MPIDHGRAVAEMIRVLDGVGDDQLAARTPCEDYSVGDLVDHVGGLSLAFTWAATKQLGQGTSQGPSGDASRLDADWRTRIPAQLTAMAEAWRDPAAWEGMTHAGGVDLPGAAAGIVALNEVAIHGWDIARASGQPYDLDPDTIGACMQFVAPVAEQAPQKGLFGPAVAVPAGATSLDRLIGLTGRDPAWRR